MHSQANWPRLAARVRARRGDRTLRDVADVSPGLTISTLSRVESGKAVDLDTFLRLCDWLAASPQEFITTTDAMEALSMSHIESVEVLLRVARCYPEEFIDALMHLLKILGEKQCN